jgi:hypothetical protein
MESKDYVVCTDADGRLYLDETGEGVPSLREAKHFKSRAEARAGLAAAQIAPTGPAEGWHIEPAPGTH